MSHGGTHPAYLPVLSFGELDLQPGIRYRFAIAYGRIPLRDGGRPGEKPDAGRSGMVGLFLNTNVNAASQMFDGFLPGEAFHLHQIGTLVFPRRIEQTAVQPGIVGENEQPLTVFIQTPYRVNILREIVQVSQRPVLRNLPGELAENTVGFVDDVVAVVRDGSRKFKKVQLQKIMIESFSMTFI